MWVSISDIRGCLSRVADIRESLASLSPSDVSLILLTFEALCYSRLSDIGESVFFVY